MEREQWTMLHRLVAYLQVSSSKASCNCFKKMGGREGGHYYAFYFIFFPAKFCGSSLKFCPQFSVKCIIASCVFFRAAQYEKKKKMSITLFEYCSNISNMLISCSD